MSGTHAPSDAARVKHWSSGSVVSQQMDIGCCIATAVHSVSVCLQGKCLAPGLQDAPPMLPLSSRPSILSMRSLRSQCWMVLSRFVTVS